MATETNVFRQEYSVAGDGKTEPTRIVTDAEGREQCPYCHQWYSRIGVHWARSTCDHPPITERKMEIIKGMVLGDGSMHRHNKNPVFQTKMINKTFIEWLSETLGWLVPSDVRMKQTARESAKLIQDSGLGDTIPEDAHDKYVLHTRTHPALERFADWYTNDGLVFPRNLSVSPWALTTWYVSDGGLNYSIYNLSEKWEEETDSSVSVVLYSANEQDRPEAIVSALEAYGFTVGQSGETFLLSTSNTEDFFDLIHEVPGFEYKYCWDDGDRYHELRDYFYDQHTTQTLE